MCHFGLDWLFGGGSGLTWGGSAWMSTPGPVRRSGGEADVGVLSHGAGHADLGAALAQDGQLSSAVHAAAGQRGVPLLLQVHGKVLVHRPAAPFPLDLRLHLQTETLQTSFLFLPTSGRTRCTLTHSNPPFFSHSGILQTFAFHADWSRFRKPTNIKDFREKRLTSPFRKQ